MRERSEKCGERERRFAKRGKCVRVEKSWTTKIRRPDHRFRNIIELSSTG